MKQHISPDNMLVKLNRPFWSWSELAWNGFGFVFFMLVVIGLMLTGFMAAQLHCARNYYAHCVALYPDDARPSFCSKQMETVIGVENRWTEEMP